MPDAPPLHDPVSCLWEAANGLQHALTSLKRIEAFAMGALAVKEIVGPSQSQFNTLAFHQPSVIPPAVNLAFHDSAFHHPTFHHPVFRPPTFHPPAVHPKMISSPKLQGNTECNYFI